ncbi:unnamed protein product [Urochloa humidicola]
MFTVTHVDSSAADSDSDSSIGFSHLFDGEAPAQIDLPMALPYATISVQSYVPMKLDLRSNNFSKWKTCFEALCGVFGGVVPHRQDDAPQPPHPEWIQEDCCFRS